MMTGPLINRIENAAIQEAINGMIKNIAYNHQDTNRLCVVGIANGGIILGRWIVERLRAILRGTIEYGIVNILFHRDDLKTKPIPKIAFPANLPFDIEEEKILLVDDVISSGRTVRAAINDLFDQGRPEQIELAVLFDRGNRRLPFQTDYLGFHKEIPLTQKVIVTIDDKNPAEKSLIVISK